MKRRLNQVLDKRDPYVSGGHQIVAPRSYKREIPQWAMSDQRIKETLLRVFPKLGSSPTQRESAARWAAVIHLYFRMGYTRSQIAHEVGSTTGKIHGILRSILRISKGLRADGKGRRGQRPRGRPKTVPHNS